VAALLFTVAHFNDVCKLTLIVPTRCLGNLGTTNWLHRWFPTPVVTTKATVKN